MFDSYAVLLGKHSNSGKAVAEVYRKSVNVGKQWDGRSHLNGIAMCQSGDVNQPLEQTGSSDMKVTTVGIDLAKNVFQLHGVNEFGKPIVKKQIRRDQMAEFFVNLPACLIGMEACSSAHHWARKLQGFGQTVKLLISQYLRRQYSTILAIELMHKMLSKFLTYE